MQLFIAILCKTLWCFVTSLRRKTKEEITERKFTLLRIPCQSFFDFGRMKYKSACLLERVGLPRAERDYLRCSFFITCGFIKLFSRNFDSIHHDSNYEKFDSKAYVYASKDSQDC